MIEDRLLEQLDLFSNDSLDGIVDKDNNHCEEPYQTPQKTEKEERYVSVPVGTNPFGNLKLMRQTIRDFCKANKKKIPKGFAQSRERTYATWIGFERTYGRKMTNRRIYTTQYDQHHP